MEKRWKLDRLGLNDADYRLLAALPKKPKSTLPEDLVFLERLQLVCEREKGWSRTTRGEQAFRIRKLQS